MSPTPETDRPALDPLLEAGAARLMRLMAAGETTAEAVMQAHLDRIAAVNPAANAIVSLRPAEACLAEAREADAARARGETLGALHGLPIAIKDLAATRGLRTTRGSPLFADWVPEADSHMVARIRAAGAIIIGKTNTPEYGLGSHTFNPIFGATRNPWDLGRSAGGSSGGASVALALRMLPMADGSDMMGSLRNPAGWGNVIGFRPSWGRVPNAAEEGDLYYQQLSTEGPMARSVADLALLLDAQAGFDPAAPLSMGEPADYSTALAASDPRPWARGLRVGWIGDWSGRWPMEPGVLEVCEQALKALEGLGAEIEPVTPDFPWERIWSAWTTLRSWTVAGKSRVDYEDPARRAHLKPEAIWEVERGLAFSAMEIHEAGVARADWHRALEALFSRYDLLAMPTAQTWPFPVDERWPREVAGVEMDSYHRWMECVTPASLAGRPTIALPAGFGAAGTPGEGLPMGLQLMGPTRGDLKVLQAAAAYEAEAPWMTARPPEPA